MYIYICVCVCVCVCVCLYVWVCVCEHVRAHAHIPNLSGTLKTRNGVHLHQESDPFNIWMFSLSVLSITEIFTPNASRDIIVLWLIMRRKWPVLFTWWSDRYFFGVHGKYTEI